MMQRGSGCAKSLAIWLNFPIFFKGFPRLTRGRDGPPMRAMRS